MIHKCLIALLGMFMSGQALAALQVPARQIVLAQKPVAPVITAFRAESTPLLAPSLLSQDRENFLAPTSLRFPGPYVPDHELERLSPVIKLKTLTLTQLSLPLVEFWDGKLELDAFQSTLRIQNVQFGPLGYGAMPDARLPQQNFPGGSRSVHLSGLSLNINFGRVGRTRRPAQAWNCVPRIVAALLN